MRFIFTSTVFTALFVFYFDHVKGIELFPADKIEWKSGSIVASKGSTNCCF